MKHLGKLEPDSDVINEEPRVLLIGYGWVNQYVGKYFTNADIVTSEGWIKKDFELYDMAVIAVPTPMNKETGQCDTSIVEQVVKKYMDVVNYFLIKSTVEIGTTDKIAKKYNVSVAMSPEYIGETLGHPLLEARRDAFQIIGGDEKTTKKIAEYWMRVLHASAPIYICSAVEAEIIKYCENLWIMQRVDYWNDVYTIAQTYSADFTKVREGLVLDPRLGRTHSNVYPNNRGWGGKCLPKDMNALAYSMRINRTPLSTVEHQIEKNKEVRKDYKQSVPLIPDNPLWVG